METKVQKKPAPRRNLLRTLGLGLITGAADDDPSAIGTYASAGAKLGPSFLWTAPFLFPMMFVVVYLSSKLGQVTGRGLFQVIRENYPRWVLHATLICVLIGNTIEAGADIGGMAAALNLFISIPGQIITVIITILILTLQIWGSYTLIRNIFRWLSIVLLAYVASAFLAKPELMVVLKGTFIPKFTFSREFMTLFVAVIGTALSAYIFTWQSNEEVEEEKAQGRNKLSERRGATDQELKKSQLDIAIGMFFSNLVMYFIILSTASTLFKNGSTDINSAAEAAKALQPLAGKAAGTLFALGIVAVGFLAVPVMTTGAAYDLSQAFRWKHSLNATPSQAPKFYVAIIFFTLAALAMNFIGINPMKALVFAGIVQGFSTPFLLLVILLMTSKPRIMGSRVNGVTTKLIGWITTIVVFAANIGLLLTWLI